MLQQMFKESKVRLKKCLFILSLLAQALPFAFSSSAHAFESTARCYELETTGSPASDSVARNPEKSVWCYEPREDGSLFIYNTDQGHVRPELAMLQSADRILTFGSLQAGRIQIHRWKSSGSMDSFSPMSVPLVEPTYQAPLFEERSDVIQRTSAEVYQQLRASAAPLQEIQISEGNYAAAIKPADLPWRGYWWAYKGQTLSNGPNSPMGKYDRFVQGQTGTSPASTVWENSHHRSTGLWWEGHCNGWVSSSILREEPRTAKRDPRTGVTFKVSDQKGLLAEKDFCSVDAFFGKRYRGKPGEDILDIYPAQFHRAVTSYINMGKPVAIDYHRDPAVDNNVISAYRSSILRTGPNTYEATTILKIHRYDATRNESPGVAQTYQKLYHYTLVVNSAGEAIGGRWISENPDFLWVPLSSGRNCSITNPMIREDWLQRILSLPGANL